MAIDYNGKQEQRRKTEKEEKQKTVCMHGLRVIVCNNGTMCVCVCAGAVTTAATSHQCWKRMMKGVIENEGATVFINAKWYNWIFRFGARA